MTGRIPEAFIHDLLARTDIVEIIGTRLELKRAGKEYKARSPFTTEKTPSFFVSPQKQMFFDFSSGKSGTVISFLMEYERLSFVEAVEELAQRAGVDVPREGGHAPRGELQGPLDALAAAQRHFSGRLRTSTVAIDYLKSRGVNGATAQLFGMGYAPDSWNDLAGFLQEERHAVEAGLLIRKESGGGERDAQQAASGRCYDRFRNRIMFPIRDSRGRTIAFGGRTLANDPAKYLNSPETPLFHKGRNLYGLYEARQSAKSALPYLIVVEGYMDVVMLAQHGLREVVGTLGTATTRDHLALLFKATNKLVFCFDGDRAGRAAAWRALEQALPEIDGTRECVFMFLPEGQDPDSLVQAIGADAFRARVEQALPLSQFLFGELARQVNLGSMDGRARLAALARPHLEKLREGPLRALMLDELSRLTRLGRADLEAMLKRPDAAPDAAATAPARSPRPPTGAARPVRRAMELLLENPALAQRVQHLEQLAQIEAPGVEILVRTLEFFQEHPGASVSQLVHFFGDSREGEAVRRLGASELNDPSFGVRLSEQAGADGMEKEFLSCINDLIKQLRTERRVALLAEARLRPLTEAETAELRALTPPTKYRSPT